MSLKLANLIGIPVSDFMRASGHMRRATRPDRPNRSARKKCLPEAVHNEDEGDGGNERTENT
jgi:hypothetical protein